MTRTIDSTLEDLLTSPDFFSDPYPAYRRLQAEAPVYWSEAWGAWVITRYADAAFALRSPALFSSQGRVTRLLRQLPDDERWQFELVERHYTSGMSHSGIADHARMRLILTKAFVPSEITARRPRVQAVVDELLDRVAGQSEFDLIEDLAYPLPAIIVAEMLGSPREDISLLRDYAIGVNRLFEGGGRVSVPAVQAAQASLEGLRDYIRSLAAERTRSPQNDVITRMAAAVQDGQMNETELVTTAVTLFVAGHETTTYVLGSGMLALLRHPDQLDNLRRHPEKIEAAVEEMLRYDTSVQRVWRLAAEDIDLGEQRISKGSLVLVMLGAANRDPARFPDPDRFDIDREDNKHLGFGVGTHFCLGAPLARIELPVAVSALLQRFPNLRLDDSEPLHWRRDVALRGLTGLKLRT